MNKSIRYFLAVAKHNNIKHAADSLHITQPTLTTAIKKLESELNAPLFLRLSKGVALTNYGEKFLVFAQKTQENYSELKFHFDDLQQRKTGKIKFGCGELWWECFVRDTLEHHFQNLGHESLHLELGNNLALMQHLINGDIDFFIGHEIEDLSKHCRVEFTPLFQDYEALFVNKQHPLLSTQWGKDELNSYPLIRVTPNHPRHQSVLSGGLPNSTEPHKVICDIDSLHASFDVLKFTNGIMPYSDKAIDWFNKFDVVPLDVNQNKTAYIGIYTKLGESKNSLLELLDTVKIQARKWEVA